MNATPVTRTTYDGPEHGRVSAESSLNRGGDDRGHGCLGRSHHGFARVSQARPSLVSGVRARNGTWTRHALIASDVTPSRGSDPAPLSKSTRVASRAQLTSSATRHCFRRCESLNGDLTVESHGILGGRWIPNRQQAVSRVAGKRSGDPIKVPAEAGDESS